MSANAMVEIRQMVPEDDLRCFKAKKKHGPSSTKFRRAVIERDKARAVYSEYREAQQHGETIA